MKIARITITTLILAIAATFCVTLSQAGESKKANLEAKAKVTKAEAQKTALAKVEGGTVKEAELEEEKGKLIWSFDISKPGTKDITEVNVDAITGKLVSVEIEKAADEAKEAKAEKKK